jgi:hypothetical protein
VIIAIFFSFQGSICKLQVVQVQKWNIRRPETIILLSQVKSDIIYFLVLIHIHTYLPLLEKKKIKTYETRDSIDMLSLCF